MTAQSGLEGAPVNYVINDVNVNESSMRDVTAVLFQEWSIKAATCPHR